jgi:hypothetical protein
MEEGLYKPPLSNKHTRVPDFFETMDLKKKVHLSDWAANRSRRILQITQYNWIIVPSMICIVYAGEFHPGQLEVLIE